MVVLYGTDGGGVYDEKNGYLFLERSRIKWKSQGQKLLHKGGRSSGRDGVLSTGHAFCKLTLGLNDWLSSALVALAWYPSEHPRAWGTLASVKC